MLGLQNRLSMWHARKQKGLLGFSLNLVNMWMTAWQTRVCCMCALISAYAKLRVTQSDNFLDKIIGMRM